MTTLSDIQRHVGVTADGKWGPNTAAAVAKALGMNAAPAASDRFAQWLPHVLKHEGGYVNHPKDPGGATNKGITQKTYDSWRDRKETPRQSVRLITDAEVSAIYRRDYWDAIKGDDLPPGVDYCVFDFAVNSGIDRAARYLQNAVGASADGKIGPATVAAARSLGAAAIINHICDARMSFLRGLRTFPTFGKGWTARVTDVRVKALAAAR
ncbi:MAG TPA: glycoside hydrolase family 108 protein [Sphingopyxis sp.]|nr:glycoside hydrolase family 108 protein [Sphingopyxis sp.]